MGSAIGYSTIWLARAGGAKAEVFYSDGNPENAKRAQDYFRLGRGLVFPGQDRPEGENKYSLIPVLGMPKFPANHRKPLFLE